MIKELLVVHFAVALLAVCVWYWRLPSAGFRGRWERLLWDKAEVKPDTGRYMCEAELVSAMSILLSWGYMILFLFWELWALFGLLRACVGRLSLTFYRKRLTRIDGELPPTARVREFSTELGAMRQAVESEIRDSESVLARWGNFRFLCPNMLNELTKLQLDLAAIVSAQEALHAGNPLPAATLFRQTLERLVLQVVTAGDTLLPGHIGLARTILARGKTRPLRWRLQYLLGSE